MSLVSEIIIISASILITIVFFIGIRIIHSNSQNKKDRSFVSNAPGIMTSVGILGTFIGVLITLISIKDIQPNEQFNLSKLLDGMQLAFITSIMGLSAAIVFKIYNTYNIKGKVLGDTNKLNRFLINLIDGVDAENVKTGTLDIKNQIMSISKVTAKIDEIYDKLNSTNNPSSLLKDIYKQLDALNKSIDNVLNKSSLINKFLTNLIKGEDVDNVKQGIRAVRNQIMSINSIAESVDEISDKLNSSKEPSQVLQSINQQLEGIKNSVTNIATESSHINRFIIDLIEGADVDNIKQDTLEVKNQIMSISNVAERVDDIFDKLNSSNDPNRTLQVINQHLENLNNSISHVRDTLETIDDYSEQNNAKFNVYLSEINESINKLSVSLNNFPDNVKESLSNLGEVGNSIGQITDHINKVKDSLDALSLNDIVKREEDYDDIILLIENINANLRIINHYATTFTKRFKT